MNKVDNDEIKNFHLNSLEGALEYWIAKPVALRGVKPVV